MNKKINVQEITSIFNENRIKILLQLFECNENICGCDLVEQIGIPKNLLSYHMKILEKRKIIEEKRCGQKKNYGLTDKGIALVKQIIKLQEIIK
ncbi:TPA: ArsR family transcriptional regulator [Candidatus Berkelbacteria bacterium]|uniref:ArsR family transcriptional regulator, ArsR family transcriptional regulator n=1 Tax=Berkelbacteria bacterium GW2011_GWE1_39_12 TaxID=1618337 RepID=A0A0G4B3J8_9BACT|nr:MAG: ArsR family transcriptional regulator, ArsR family transcriptional regulator [Berkelbacteria bacterium GW2011_GWE1_39_12]HBO60384.1 ArsR family transcriptional regulator [Candidatus Berkelbacteria bacterium]